MIDYVDASDFFNAVKRAVESAQRAEQVINELMAAESLSGAPLTQKVSTGGQSDVMARTDARIDLERVYDVRLKARDEMVHAAEVVLYGSDGGGGLSAVGSDLMADVVYLRYVQARPWKLIACALGRSESRCRTLNHAALDLMDAYGCLRVVGGVGLATV